MNEQELLTIDLDPDVLAEMRLTEAPKKRQNSQEEGREAMGNKAAAIAKLQGLLTPGDTVYGIVRHVSRSGMQRVLDFMVVKDAAPYYIRGAVGDALRLRTHKQYDGLVVHGCGMNMLFACVYDLGRVLYPEGVGCTGTHCTSNDHGNGDRDFTPDSPAFSHRHEDGGYAFRSISL